jgi:hypothetical protein
MRRTLPFAALLTLLASAAWAQLPGDRVPLPGVGGTVTQPEPERRAPSDPMPADPGTTAESGATVPDLASPGGSLARQPQPPGRDPRPSDAPASMVPGMESTEPTAAMPVPDPPREGESTVNRQ